MKSTLAVSPSAARAKRAPRRPGRAQDNSSYISAAETRALLADSLTARNARLAGDDLLSTDEAAEIAGTSRVTINAWIEKGRCIGLSQTKRGFRVPRWQFEPRLWAMVPKLAAALQTREGWQLLAFLESPQGALGGLTPRAAIEQGKAERVLSIAEHDGH